MDLQVSGAGEPVAARSSAIVWTRSRAERVTIGHLLTMGPEIVAPLSAILGALLILLRDERDRRMRQQGRLRTREDDPPRTDDLS